MEAVRPIRPRRTATRTARSAFGPNSFVIIHDGVNDSIAVDAEACEIKPTWNAAVCKGDVGRMNVGGGGGARGAGAGGAPGGRGAAAGPGAPGGRRSCRTWRTWWSRRGCRSWRTWLLEAQLLDLAHLVVEARLPVLAHLVVEARLPVELLLSRQSFSAAMARSTP